MPATTTESMQALRELVRAHRVYYEVRPEMHVGEGERTQIGFQLSLWASHPHGARALPGCPKCSDLHRDLRRIAEWIIPREERASRYEIEPFDRALYASTRQKDVDEVDLTIDILHRHGFDRPLDECQERCLREMRGRLAELGIHEGGWSPSPSAAGSRP